MREPSQQQTLSVRIGEGLRRKLERARALEIARTGHTVSVSEVAKKLLESGREDRLEVVHLLSDPTAALASIRPKADAGHVLSRAEWTVVCHFVREGLEAFSTATPRLLSAALIVTAVDAFQALLRERPLHCAVRNRTYLESLGPSPSSTVSRSTNSGRGCHQSHCGRLVTRTENGPLLLDQKLTKAGSRRACPPAVILLISSRRQRLVCRGLRALAVWLLCRKRQDSLPVSMRWQRGVRRSSSAVVIGDRRRLLPVRRRSRSW
jgi:hypothetical protein